jgi:hypothetical protein
MHAGGVLRWAGLFPALLSTSAIAEIVNAHYSCISSSLCSLICHGGRTEPVSCSPQQSTC